MKTQLTEQSDVSCLSEFDPALILLKRFKDVTKGMVGIYYRFIQKSVWSVKLGLDLIRRRPYGLRLMSLKLHKSSAH